MKALKILGSVLGLLVLAYLITAALAPANFEVERSTVIDASAETIYPHVQNFKQFQVWSPWAKKDPNMTSEIVGPDGHEGTILKWSGNEMVGTGEQELIEVDAPKTVVSQLRFSEPWESQSTAAIHLTPADQGTKVSWVLNGDFGFMERPMMLMMDMDEMVGKDYEEGLAALKIVVDQEVAARQAAALKQAAMEAAATEAAVGNE